MDFSVSFNETKKKIVKAIGLGTGWMQATYTICGITYASPKKYVTCIP
jgi:hypothetical protein